MQYTSQYKDGVVNVTTAEYVSGSGTKVNKVGLTPDIEIHEDDMSDEEVENAIEAQKSGDVRDFVRKNPEYSIEAVERGVDELIVKYPVPRRALASLLLLEYRNMSEKANSTIAYPMYDSVLNKAISMIESSLATNGSVFDFVQERETQKQEPKAAND